MFDGLQYKLVLYVIYIAHGLGVAPVKGLLNINGTQNDSYQINHLYTQNICTTIKAGAHQLVKRLD